MNLLLRSFSITMLGAALCTSQKSMAQLVGNEAFLQSEFVEVGIATNGAFGTDASAPAGYHARDGSGGTKLGFVSDPNKDGWGVGTPNYIGDYFLPGSPQEGWDMELNGVWAQAWRGSGGTSFTGGLTGKVTTYNSTAAGVEAIWEGTLGPLKIIGSTKIRTGKLFFTTKVKIYNTSGATLYNLYYDRTVDPDQEVATPGGAGFITDNKIIYALPSTGNKTLVTSIGTSAIKSYLGLASRDCRARPYIVVSGLTPTDSLHSLHSANGTTNAISKVDSLHTQDCGIGIVFKIDSLRAGDSTQLSYAYVLSTADVDSAFEDLKPQLNIGGKVYVSGDTLKACNGSVLNIDIVGGDFYQWKWSPKIGLSDSVGSRIKITAGTVPITYTATAISDLCPIDPITITIDPIANPITPKVVTPLYYCQYDAAAPLTATASPGSVLQYYYAATGGTALPTITPVTTAAGSKYYYVSQISGALCESSRERIEIITRAIPVIDSFKNTHPTYCGATDGTITFVTDSANITYILTYDKDGAPAAPVSFTSNSKGSYTLGGLSGGVYTNFIVVNSYGCKSSPFAGPVNLIDPKPAGPPLTNNGPLCVGATAIFNAPFIAGAVYTWTGPDGFKSTDRNPTFTVTEKSGGVYTLIVRVGPCIYKPSTSALIITPTPKHQEFLPMYQLCEGTKLDIDILREGNVTYEWTGNGINLLNQGLVIPGISLAQSGQYMLTSTSNNGCITLDSLTVQVDKRSSFSIVPDTSICSIDSASLTVNSDAVSILWTPETGLNSTTKFDIKARPSATTVYTATTKSGNTCPDTSGTVKVSVIPTPMVKGYDTLVRMNIPYTILPTFGQEVVKWKWTPSDSLSCADCPNPTFNSNKQMTYVVYGTDINGCTGSDKVTITVFCDGANVTMPNAFTPNGDGDNDIFYVRGTGFTVKSFAVYNRLGQEVFRKENFAPNDPQYGWNGSFGGQEISDAAGFVYMMEVVCFDSKNEPMVIKGTVLMIK